MKLLKNKNEIFKGQILAVKSCGNLFIGHCTGVKVYPGDKVWYGLSPNNTSVGVAINSLINDESITDYVIACGGFFGFDKNPVYDISAVIN